MEFTQHAWLAKYIDFNTRMRAAASSKFEKDFYKLMNNAVFGKSQENLRNRLSVRIVTNGKAAKKIVDMQDALQVVKELKRLIRQLFTS